MSATTIAATPREHQRSRRAPVRVGRGAHPSHPHPHLHLHRQDSGRTTRPPTGRISGEEVTGLVERAASGDPCAWEELVHEFSGMVRAVARSHRLSDADVGDVAQVTWLRLFEHLDRITEPARVGAWLATTARRESLRLLRGAQRHALVGEDLPERELSESSADEALIAAERDVVLWRCFTRLRERDQTLLHLVLAEPRLGYEEIAAALAMPIGSIGPTRARALERLHRELDREDALELVLAS
jgi:RNA polymerase sigma factor (sigma-70 family)